MTYNNNTNNYIIIMSTITSTAMLPVRASATMKASRNVNLAPHDQHASKGTADFKSRALALREDHLADSDNLPADHA